MPGSIGDRKRSAAGGRGWRWSWRAYTAAAAGLVVLAAAVVTAVLVGQAPGQQGSAGATGEPQWISGPSWTLPPTRVSSAFFGVTINTPTGHMPGFPIGALRLWDSETRWAQIQPARGEFDWATLDRLVGGAEAAGLPVLFVAGGTPSWAAPEGKRSVYPENARSAPPDDLGDWDAFVRALTQRYRGRIEAYEIWAFANDARLFSGSVETLVEMTERASAIIRAADPLATVVCPGMGNLWSPEAQQVMRRFAQLGGYRHCNVAGIKLHQRTAEDPPETMLELTGNVDRIFDDAGINPPLWNTGTTYAIPLQGSLAEPKARNYAVRFFLVGLFARNVHLDRMYFYNWGGTKIPIVLQADGGAPTAAGLAVAQLQRWLATAEIRACGHGPAVGLPVNAWQCEFTVDTPLGRRRAVIRWTHAGTATMTADAGVVELLRLDGTTTALRQGGELALTEEPVLIRFDA
ncbi:beta-galactosidase [Dactylosporangium sp. AC04546]|uniref:beta-galactosidase n=1 Tax=Dactylosporangium sp. AC04546 TaxID=2862460 RepID=UPI002E7B3C83|nr:beta-galactosidase [Dactylosporangium sp. AC04546]WVK87822.1 beta-galactosidase [Dactylosporangium sp. AC04546]